MKAAALLQASNAIKFSAPPPAKLASGQTCNQPATSFNYLFYHNKIVKAVYLWHYRKHSCCYQHGQHNLVSSCNKWLDPFINTELNTNRYLCAPMLAAIRSPVLLSSSRQPCTIPHCPVMRPHEEPPESHEKKSGIAAHSGLAILLTACLFSADWLWKPSPMQT